jgi:DNA-binding transcriptional LysR family regulator
LTGFRARCPGIAIDLVLDDRMTDFTTDRVDVAFRDGRLEDSQIVAKQLIPMQMVVCASPRYIASHGQPRRIEDLSRHACIAFRAATGRVADWEFKVGGRKQTLTPSSSLTLNDPGLVLQSVLDGAGIAQMGAYQVCGHLREGRLVACLAQHAPDDRGHYLCYLSRQHMPGRIRVFIDYMTEAVRALDLQYIEGLSPASELMRRGQHGGHAAAPTGGLLPHLA